MGLRRMKRTRKETKQRGKTKTVHYRFSDCKKKLRRYTIDISVSATDVLPAVVEDGPLPSRELADRVDDSRDYTASTTRLAKDLAGYDTDSRDDAVAVWTDQPLLTGDREGWVATEYGKAATHALQLHLARKETHPFIASLKAGLVSDDLLSSALSEVGGTDSVETLNN